MGVTLPPGDDMSIGDIVVLNGIRGIVRYIGARGHLGVDMADGTFQVVAPSEVQREFCKPDAGSIQASMNAYKKQGKSIEEIQERIGGIVITERVK